MEEGARAVIEAATRRLGSQHDVLFPPELVSLIRALLGEHPAIRGVPDSAIARLLTLVFFTSLETEEGESHVVRVAFVGRDGLSRLPLPSDPCATPPWRPLLFRRSTACDSRHLRRLARAASGRLFVLVALVEGRLQIVGLARKGPRYAEDSVLEVMAPTPGGLEVWVGVHRVVKYARGRLETPPENVLLSPGPVRRALSAYAAAARVRMGYVEAVGSLVRQMSAHGYGGILIISEARDPLLPGEGGFSTDTDLPLAVLLRQLGDHDLALGTPPGTDTTGVLLDALRAEAARVIGELARLSALDGATLLDYTLGLRAFGLVLPILPEVVVLEASDAEAHRATPFSLLQRGARHRAAASHAYAHPRSLVFVASSDGDLGCMLREPTAAHVLFWRFHQSDLSPL